MFTQVRSDVALESAGELVGDCGQPVGHCAFEGMIVIAILFFSSFDQAVMLQGEDHCRGVHPAQVGLVCDRNMIIFF